jgi:hypothetical protein
MDYSVIATVAKGASLDITGVSANGAWLQIVTNDGKQGWVSSQPAYIRISGSLNDLPAAGGTSGSRPSVSNGTVVSSQTPTVTAQASASAGQPASTTPTFNGKLVFTTSSAAVEQAASATGASLSGEWDFSFGTMSLTQRESGVKGSYQWYGGADTGRIEGAVVAELDQFQGIWISNRSPNSQKLLRWQLAADHNSFSGSSVGGSTSQQWCGVRSGQPLPSGCGFSGTWQLRFGSPPGLTGQAILVQTGQTVQGTYLDSEGHTGEIVDGVITVQSTTEVTLTGVWRNDQGEQDSFEWRLDLTTGRTFQGRRDPGNSEWCGWREGASEPEQCGWKD